MAVAYTVLHIHMCSVYCAVFRFLSFLIMADVPLTVIGSPVLTCLLDSDGPQDALR